MEPRIAPSILAADFARLGAQVQEVLDAGAQVIHVDVMDGHFVPPITMGPIVVSALKEQALAAGAMLDVHLMIERPESQIAAFVDAGADNITVHFEATPHVNYAVKAIKEAGRGAGVAITPSTPAAALADLAAIVDVALCMTVNPGWGGQPFIDSSPGKIRALSGLIGPDTHLEVDGGVDLRTLPLCREAGATLFVAGTSVFGSPDPGEAFRRLTEALSG